jgi:hypothetical protein
MSVHQSSDSTPLLSVVVITRNEADRIGRLLASVTFADEVVVVDSGSTDDTVRICRAAGAKVVHRDWQGYAEQKQAALELGSGEWILNLDADEAISDLSATEIFLAIAKAPSDAVGFSMPRLSRYLNRWIRHGGWYPDRKVRLVRRAMGKWIGEGIHERLEVSGRVLELKQPILHYVYRSISDQVRTINSFSTLTAEHAGRAGTRLYLLYGLLHAVGKFLECAVWKMGFLDGMAGLVIAVNSSFYVFLKHAKTWEKSLPRDDSQ